MAAARKAAARKVETRADTKVDARASLVAARVREHSQIMKVVNQVYGSQVTASLGTKGEGLPVQQKILVASLLLMVKRGRTKEVTEGNWERDRVG